MKLMVSNVPALYAIHPKDYYAETEIELKHAYAHQAIGFGTIIRYVVNVHVIGFLIKAILVAILYHIQV
ncbi:unnamed protein product [Rotaria socialis]